MPFLFSLLSRIIALPVHTYRMFLSPLLPANCRFQPSCSEYALEALARHGPWRGSWLMFRRLARCHPVKFLGSGSGWDPVPPPDPPGQKPRRR